MNLYFRWLNQKRSAPAPSSISLHFLITTFDSNNTYTLSTTTNNLPISHNNCYFLPISHHFSSINSVPHNASSTPPPNKSQ